MRTMARAVVLLLVLAFVAGVWDSRYGQERRPARPAAPFRTDPLERDRQARPAPELVSVQAVERKGYDRVLFTFKGAVPGYQVRYVPEVTDQAGRPLALRGRAFLAVAFEPARAHDPGGARCASPGTSRAGSPSAWAWPSGTGSGSRSCATRPGSRSTSASRARFRSGRIELFETP